MEEKEPKSVTLEYRLSLNTPLNEDASFITGEAKNAQRIISEMVKEIKSTSFMVEEGSFTGFNALKKAIVGKPIVIRMFLIGKTRESKPIREYINEIIPYFSDLEERVISRIEAETTLKRK